MGLLARGQALLNRTFSEYEAVTVIYVRGELSAPVCAWRGRTLFAVEPKRQGGARVEWGEMDYLLLLADLYDAGFGEPAEGDRIVDTFCEPAGETTFEVMKNLAEPAWRYSDHGRTRARVHAKRVN